jgi:hypothetical protein
LADDWLLLFDDDNQPVAAPGRQRLDAPGRRRLRNGSPQILVQ